MTYVNNETPHDIGVPVDHRPVLGHDLVMPGDNDN
jgi:hypothetical protein